MEKTIIPRAFLLILLSFAIYLCYLVIKPFLVEIIVAAVLASIFYPLYSRLVNGLKGRKKTSALIMCLLIALIVIVPLINLVIYGANKSIEAYGHIANFVSQRGIDGILVDSFFDKINFLGINIENYKDLLFSALQKVNNSLVSGATTLIKETTNFFVSLILIIFTMFFFFVDGESMIKQLMRWTPLSNKYDEALFKKFRDVSYSTIVSTFVTAIAQGLIGALGFAIAGLPVFFGGILIAFFSLMPYVGAGIIWVPAAVYLLVIGKVWQGVFILVWGGAVISSVDNLIRAYIIKGKSQVHPIFIIFSILGGVILFGFWGIVFGPLIISIAVTLLHIYELEYEEVLEK